MATEQFPAFRALSLVVRFVGWGAAALLGFAAYVVGVNAEQFFPAEPRWAGLAACGCCVAGLVAVALAELLYEAMTVLFEIARQARRTADAAEAHLKLFHWSLENRGKPKP